MYPTGPITESEDLFSQLTLDVFEEYLHFYTASHNKTLVGGHGSILYPHFPSFPQSPCNGREWLSVSASGELLDLGWTGEF